MSIYILSVPPCVLGNSRMGLLRLDPKLSVPETFPDCAAPFFSWCFPGCHIKSPLTHRQDQPILALLSFGSAAQPEQEAAFRMHDAIAAG
jgi:hypothetical protein